MTHPILRGLAIASALLAIAIPAEAARQTLPTIKVIGVDTVCDSFTLSTDDTGLILTCVAPGTTPPGAPQGCIATVNSAPTLTLPSTGGNANLAVTCSSPTTGLSFNWSRNGVPGAATAASWIDTPLANPALGANTGTIDKISSYQVQVCNGLSCVTVPTVPLTATVPPMPELPGGG